MQTFKQFITEASIVRNPNFKKWFRGSKVIDVGGKPLIVYHGTRNGGFDVFRPYIRKQEQLGFGIHFTESSEFAQRYVDDETVARKGKHQQLYAVYLRVLSPLYADSLVLEGTPEFEFGKKLAGRKFWTMKNEHGVPTAYIQHCIDAANPIKAEQLIREAGYDGVKYISTIGTRGYGARITGKAESWVVFEPTQIKSIDNNGNFDINNPNIFE